MYRILLFLAVACIFLSCTSNTKDLSGTWRGIVDMQGQELPFTFTLSKEADKYTAVIRNAEEKLVLDDVQVIDDTLVMVMHIFDAQIRAKVLDDKLNGVFIKNYDLSATVPFRATKGDNYRFVKKEKASIDFNGKYSVTFTNEKDTTLAIGIFTQNENEIKGTFLTPTGDYRYLQGNIIGETMKLSVFDGNHTFVFTANLKGDSIVGDYYSGKTYHQIWKGVKTESASLPHPESLTYLKEGFDKIEFSFPDVEGRKVTPQDDKYKNKVVILQLFGTWCPNCMDETRFLADWYTQNNKRGVEIIGLAYERKDDFTYASDRVKKMKEKLNVTYDFVIAGVNDKVKAAETLPMLNKVVAFPTTIFIGKDGKVKYIHTGFSGPGTGIYYEQFKESFNQKINELLAGS
jgi:thiol-disulfide isomerase/thioredoxin